MDFNIFAICFFGIFSHINGFEGTKIYLRGLGPKEALKKLQSNGHKAEEKLFNTENNIEKITNEAWKEKLKEEVTRLKEELEYLASSIPEMKRRYTTREMSSLLSRSHETLTQIKKLDDEIVNNVRMNPQILSEPLTAISDFVPEDIKSLAADLDEAIDTTRSSLFFIKNKLSYLADGPNKDNLTAKVEEIENLHNFIIKARIIQRAQCNEDSLFYDKDTLKEALHDTRHLNNDIAEVEYHIMNEIIKYSQECEGQRNSDEHKSKQNEEIKIKTFKSSLDKNNNWKETWRNKVNKNLRGNIDAANIDKSKSDIKNGPTINKFKDIFDLIMQFKIKGKRRDKIWKDIERIRQKRGIRDDTKCKCDREFIAEGKYRLKRNATAGENDDICDKDCKTYSQMLLDVMDITIALTRQLQSLETTVPTLPPCASTDRIVEKFGTVTNSFSNAIGIIPNTIKFKNYKICVNKKLTNDLIRNMFDIHDDIENLLKEIRLLMVCCIEMLP